MSMLSFNSNGISIGDHGVQTTFLGRLYALLMLPIEAVRFLFTGKLEVLKVPEWGIKIEEKSSAVR